MPTPPIDEVSILYGTIGVGKTSMAITDSEQCPEWHTHAVKAPPPGPVIDIEDIAWVRYDKGGLDGLEQQRLRVVHDFDLADGDPSRVVEDTLDKLATLKAKKGLRGVVFDTGLAFDTQLTIKHIARADQKLAYYEALLRDHMKVFGAIRQLGVHLQILTQLKVAFDADEAQKRKRAANGLPDIYANVASGQTGFRYKGDASNILKLVRTKDLTAKPPCDVVWAMVREAGSETKMRKGLGVPDKVEADWRVIRKWQRGEVVA